MKDSTFVAKDAGYAQRVRESFARQGAMTLREPLADDSGGVVVEPRIGGGYSGPIVLLVAPAALAVFLLNLIYIAPDLQQVRVALPQRVEEEELELHPAPLPQPTNPWDDVAPP